MILIFLNISHAFLYHLHPKKCSFRDFTPKNLCYIQCTTPAFLCQEKHYSSAHNSASVSYVHTFASSTNSTPYDCKHSVVFGPILYAFTFFFHSVPAFLLNRSSDLICLPADVSLKTHR